MKLAGTGLEPHGHYPALYSRPGADPSSFIPDTELTRSDPAGVNTLNIGLLNYRALMSHNTPVALSTSLFLMNINATNIQ